MRSLGKSRKSVDLLTSKDKQKKAVGLKHVLDSIRKADRAIHSNLDRLLRESLFNGMFSAFDVFTGDLLRGIFQKKTTLFKSLNRTVDVSTILECTTLDELKRNLVEDEIESFRRESYADQFARLESLFGLKLRNFPRWRDFVERAQRRNLLTHCDGLVTDQYLAACRSVSATSDAKVGQRLDVSPSYLKETVELLMEVGLKLGQTLWRKILPGELKDSDKSLNETDLQSSPR